MLDIIRTRLNALKGDRRGVTAVEYAVVAAVIIGVAVVTFTAIGTDIATALAPVIAAL